MKVANSNESYEIGPEIGMGDGSQDIVQAEEDNENSSTPATTIPEPPACPVELLL